MKNLLKISIAFFLFRCFWALAEKDFQNAFLSLSIIALSCFIFISKYSKA